MGNSESADAGEKKSIIYNMTVENFPDGCYFVMHYNPADATKANVYLTEPGSLYNVTYASKPTTLNCKPSVSTELKLGEVSTIASIRVRSMIDGALGTNYENYTYKLKVNGHDIGATMHDSTTDGKTSSTGITSGAEFGYSKAFVDATISADWFNQSTSMQYLKPTTFVTFEVYKKAAEGQAEELFGIGAIVLTIQFEKAPELVSDPLITLTEIQDTQILFNYTGVTEINAENVRVYSAVNNRLMSIAESNRLSAEDYTVEAGETQGTWKVTIKGSYLESVFTTFNTRLFYVLFGDHQLATVIYRRSDAEGWLYRAGDYVADTMVKDEYYISATMTRFTEADLSSRIFYNNAVSVSAPITIEFSNIDSSVEWAMLSVMNTYAISDYFSDNTKEDAGNLLSMLLFGQGRSDIQKYTGFVSTASTNANYDPVTMKNNLVEIYFAPDADHADEGYVKINGTKVGDPSVYQSNFPDNKAYIGMFFNNQKTTHSFTVNTHVNAVAITTAEEDSYYAMDLGKATDFAVTLANTSGKLKLTDETGKVLAADEFAYADGTLTVKAKYFSEKIFTKEGVIYIFDTETNTGTSFRMAYSSSKLGAPNLAFATLGAISDVSFKLNGVKSVSGVLVGENQLSADRYAFADGSLTIKSAAIANSAGEQEFIAITDQGLFPCYVAVRAWENGVCKTGEGTLAAEKETNRLTGILAYDVMKAYDLAKGVTFGVNFEQIGAYYKNGANNAYTSATFRFYDPYTAYTLSVTVMANYEDSAVSSVNNALYVSYGIYNAEGGMVFATVSRGVNLSSNENNKSSSGLQSVQVQSVDGGIKITVGGRDFTIPANGLNGFNTQACMLTVNTANSTSDSVVSVTAFDGLVNVYDQKQPDPDDSEDPDPKPPVENKGCGGTVGGAALIGAAGVLTCALAALCVCRRKNGDRK